MFDGSVQQLGHLAALGEATLIVRTKAGAGAGQYVSLSSDDKTNEGAAEAITPFQTSVNEYVELTTNAGRMVKCAPRTKLCLAGGGYCYAEESNGAIVDTESGPDVVQVASRGTGESMPF
jgi:hypothetical protein